MKKVLGGILLLTILAIAIYAYISQESTQRPIPIQANAPKLVIIDRGEVLQTTNDYRASKGLDPLTENDLLNKSACAKAQHMVSNNYWAHDAPDGTEPSHFFAQVNYEYHNAGENLAYGHKNGFSVVSSWIESAGHEKNLAGDYTETGVCVLNNVTYQNRLSTNLIVAHYAKP